VHRITLPDGEPVWLVTQNDAARHALLPFTLRPTAWRCSTSGFRLRAQVWNCGDELFEAWQLTTWYLQLGILRLLDTEGQRGASLPHTRSAERRP
jgi:hypothetical protein